MPNTDFTVTEVSFANYRKYPQGYCITMKSRGQYGLTLVLSGELEMTIDGKTMVAGVGDILLQRKGDSYKLEAKHPDGAEYIVISYLAEPEQILQKYLPSRLFCSEHLNRYRHAFENAARVSISYSACHKPLLRALVQEIVCNVIQDNYPKILSAEKNPVAYAKQYIEQYCHCSLSVNDIAAVVGISPSYLRTLFQKTERESPIHYLNRIRIERAREMLSSKMFSLDEIASACGFQNVYYFNRVFKKFTGIPPGKY